MAFSDHISIYYSIYIYIYIYIIGMRSTYIIHTIELGYKLEWSFDMQSFI